MRLSSTPSILMPLPDYDFDPTEASLPWKACTSRGWQVTISTEHGNIAQCDPYKLKGVLAGLLAAGAKAQAAYGQMIQDPAYQQPVPYEEIDPDQHEALVLPGGDALRMRQYLESRVLQSKVLQFWQQGKLIGAICHGVLVLARTIDPRTGHSVMYGRKVTATPRSLDRLADWLDSRLVKHGYIVYSCYVADEVRACLEHPEDFSTGGNPFVPYVVSDGNMITARWSIDADLFAERFVRTLEQRMSAEKSPA